MFNNKKAVIGLFSLILVFSMSLPSIAFDLFQKAKESAGSDGAVSGKTSSEPTTYRNADRKFSFTIPAGWELVSGDPARDNASFRKSGKALHFSLHYTSMASDFPAEKSVQVSLKTAKDEIKQGKNISAKRRDDFCGQKDKKTTCARGWELIDSGNGGIQRIIWQCYDRNNFYFNFMANSDTPEFKAGQEELQKIMDSIQFEK